MNTVLSVEFQYVAEARKRSFLDKLRHKSGELEIRMTDVDTMIVHNREELRAALDAYRHRMECNKPNKKVNQWLSFKISGQIDGEEIGTHDINCSNAFDKFFARYPQMNPNGDFIPTKRVK